jgi:membrane dipeptidase
VALDLREARALHDEVPVIDLHADTPKLMDRVGLDLAVDHSATGAAGVLGRATRASRSAGVHLAGHVDLPRMRSGGVAAQIFGMWTLPYPQRGCAASIDRQLDAIDAAAARLPEQMCWARSTEEIRAAQAGGRVAALAGIEGGHALEGDAANVERFARRGVRYLGLLHFSANELGAPARGRGEDPHRGLSRFGAEVIREMNRCGMVVDLAHINRKGFFEALEVGRAPPMVTHTGVSGVHPHWRNVDDEQLRAVAQAGGCVGIIFARKFLGGKTIEAVVDHILHIIRVAGEDVPALGSDFDGFVVPPVGLEDVSRMPELTAALSRRGLGRATLKKILGENVLRVLSEVPPARFA